MNYQFDNAATFPEDFSNDLQLELTVNSCSVPILDRTHLRSLQSVTCGDGSNRKFTDSLYLNGLDKHNRTWLIENKDKGM